MIAPSVSISMVAAVVTSTSNLPAPRKDQTCHDGRSMRRSRSVIDVVLANKPVKFSDPFLRREECLF
jgi:hypothetical protein